MGSAVAELNRVHSMLLEALDPSVVEGAQTATKENLERVVDHFSLRGYSDEDVVKAIDDRLGSTALADAGPGEYSEAVDTLAAELPVPETAQPEAAEEPVGDVFAALAEAAGQDVEEAFTPVSEEVAAAAVREIWAQVVPAIQAEVAQSPESWQDPDALREAAYWALCDALEGYLDAVGAQGGLAVDLTSAP